MEYTKYAAVGHFKCHRTLDGKKYPVVIVGRKEYMLDVQEMTVWSSLAWRILSRRQIAETYLKLTRRAVVYVTPDTGRLHRPARHARSGRGGTRQQRV